MKKKNVFTIAIAAILVVVMAVAFTACGDNKDKEPATTEPTSTEAPVSTTETVKPIEDEETETTSHSTTEEVVETEALTTTKTQNSGSSGNSGNGGGSSSGGNAYKPTEASKPTSKPTEAPTKAPETTKKQETKPVVNQNDDVEVKDKDREEVPTYADGSFDMGAMIDKTEEEEGPGGYF